MKHLNIYLILLLILVTSCKKSVTHPSIVNQYPNIYPNYVGVTIPVNIAPLNFMASPAVDLIDVEIKGQKTTLHFQENAAIAIPNEKWKKYKAFSIHVSPDTIDYGLAYRLIAPGYEVYSKMGIYQRNLSNFDQTPIMENTLVTGCCVNCHAFRHNNPDCMSFHVRGDNGATVLQQKGKGSERVMDTKTDNTISSCVYPYWHPDGRYIAYS